MKILAIETSCDETAAAVTDGRRVLSNVVFSQINLHRQYGGVFPSLAKRTHEEKIEPVIKKALKISGLKIKSIEAIAVTFGPGLVIALEVGLRKAKDLASQYHKPLIPVNHLEGHLYSCFGENRQGKPAREFLFPFLALLVSGGYTGLILVKDHLRYQVLGKTLDDAAGEALDKAARILGMSYPGGPIIERLAQTGDPNFLSLPVPMRNNSGFNFSYSGLKTAFKDRLSAKSADQIAINLANFAASFQKAIISSLVGKLKKAILTTGTQLIIAGGGVLANRVLHQEIRNLAKKEKILVYFPPTKRLTGDNAAMIGVAANYKYLKGIYLKDHFERLDRVGRPDINLWTLGDR